MKKIYKKKSGYTLIELIISIGIVSILGTSAVLLYQFVQTKLYTNKMYEDLMGIVQIQRTALNNNFYVEPLTATCEKLKKISDYSQDFERMNQSCNFRHSDSNTRISVLKSFSPIDKYERGVITVQYSGSKGGMLNDKYATKVDHKNLFYRLNKENSIDVEWVNGRKQMTIYLLKPEYIQEKK